LYGYEIWSLYFRGEHKIQKSEKSAQNIFELTKCKVHKELRILRNEELGDLCRPLSVIGAMNSRRLSCVGQEMHTDI
jgi:hypothetical protein